MVLAMTSNELRRGSTEGRSIMPRDQAPEHVNAQSVRDYLEVMCKAIFQAGISWRVVESKWPELREAFRGFDADTVANLNEAELDELTSDRRVSRNRRKIELEKSHGSFRNYLRSHNGFEETVKDLRKQFKFLGDTGCYFFLYVLGEEVPSHEECIGPRQRSASR